MNILLPEIKKVNCKSFTACAHVATKDKSLSKIFTGKRPFIASVKKGTSHQFVRLCIEKSGHLHLDVATPAYFSKGWKPKPTHTWQQIQKSLGCLVGQKIQVRTDAIFSVPFQKLPESGFIRMLSVESESPKVSMKLTGATFTVTGAPIQRIAWSLKPSGKEIEIRLRSTVKTTLKDSYLEDLFRLLNESLQVFVLGAESTERTPIEI
jgi:hypothetical protein